MTLEQIRLIIATRLAAWDEAPIAWNNVPLSPDVIVAQQADPKQPWIRATILNGDGITATFKDDVIRTGILAIQIFTARNVGERPAALLADSLIDQLEHYRSGGLKLRQANPGGGVPDDGWHQLNLSIPFVAI